MSIRRMSLLSLIAPAIAFADSPEILINAQGLAQQDISIRGSSYTGTGISINGINLKVPYSAHFNTELPAFGTLLSEGEAQSGLKNVSGHLVGTSAMNTQSLDQQSSISAGVGTDERFGGSIASSSENMGVYLDGEKAFGIDYDANDLERIAGMGAVQMVCDDWQFDILAGGQHKEYGAQGYYGIPAHVYAEEQTDDALLLASAFKGDLAGAFMRTGFSVREFDSEYHIPSSNFTSDVESGYGSAMVEGRTLEIQNIALNLRGDIEHERIDGDIGEHDRTRGSILMLPEARLDRFTIKAGLNSVFQTAESAEWLPQAGLDFFATDNVKLYASYSENVQQPDYQNLYYADPYHTGYTSLSQQKSRNTELGLHQFLSANMDWQAAVFHRRQENAVDWTKATSVDPTWTATDLGALDVTGIDAKANYLASDQLELQLYYQWITKDDYDVYAGLYELDYPEHLLAMSGFWQIAPEFQLFGAQTLRYQTGNNVRKGNDFGAQASLGLHYAPRFANNVRLSFLVENLWNTDFQTIPGLKPRPIAASTGITVIW